ncbi:MAG: translation initiation factor IF-2 [Proteobacteria bacterium]|nr:translation initiation factor IF-2 [Pseudomonadota bacterium]
MSDANDNDGKPAGGAPAGGRAPLTLKPRAAGSVSTGVVRQSFSHGRSKTVVVETKRRRTDAPGAPAAAEKHPAFDLKPRPRPETPAPAPAAPREPQPTGGLSAEEMEARRRAIDTARQEQERRDAEQRAIDAQRRAEEEARRAAEAARIAAEAPKAEAQPAPAAEAPKPAATPQPERPAFVPRAAPERPAPTFTPREPRPEGGHRGGDRPQQGGYGPRGDRPQGQGGYAARSGPGFGPRGDRPQGQGYGAPRGDRPPREGGGYGAPRGEGGYRGAGDRGPRPAGAAAGGETVRYSALSPRPAPGAPRPGGPRPGGPRPPAAGAPPAGPEVTRPTRGAPMARPGDRRDDDRGRKVGSGDPGKAVSRTKGEPKRREGRLTIQAVAGDGDTAERMRSLASVRRAREREKEKRKGGVAEAPRVAREVVIPDVITVQELSNRMAVRGVDIIKFLMRQGMMLKINDVIDNDTAELVATDFGHTVKRVSEADVEEGFIDSHDADEDMVPRPPVVAVMGHVDHGKTSLLDALRTTDVAAGEAGGITQHIGAYQVRLPDGQRVSFLDTPGHAAFSAMRARGANVTDIVVLVVAADDGVMPQTVEAINHAKAAGAPIIVAINKIDKPDADPTRVINELLQHEIVAESLGGDTQMIEVSATKRMGLDHLIDAILVQAEVMDLRANPDRSAEGVVIEAKLDKGRGPVATVLVKRGTLKRGDIVVAGDAWGRVRALMNERSEQVQTAGPSEPVEILGLDSAPEPGVQLAVVEDEARARELTEYRERKRREKSVIPSVAAGASLADLMSKLQDKKLKELPLIIKADVQGSAEAIVGSLAKLATDEVRARIILSGVGGINESDVLLAKGANSPIIGFNVRASKQARDLAEREGVEIRYYAIIYDLIDDLKGVMSGMLAPIQRETFLGNAEVLEAFDISKIGRVAGCRVTEGSVRRGAKVRIVRDDVVIQEMGTLQTLKRFKDDVNEVVVGQECGMSFANFQDIKKGDLIECFTVEEVKRSL